VDLSVSREKAGPGQFLCTVIGRPDARDDRGNVLKTPSLPAHQRLELMGVDYPRKSGSASIHLSVDKEAQSIQSLSGELLVADAKIHTATFEGDGLKKRSSRRLGRVTIRLNDFVSTKQGISVNLGIALARTGSLEQDVEFLSHLHERLDFVLEDSEGKTHLFRSSSGGGGGSASGGFGSGGAGAFSDFGGRGGNRSGGAGLTMSQHLEFAPLPEGVTARKLVCTLTEFLSEPQTVPFEFKDLPIPE
jgi:hypothetical protein